ncbi:DUF389 domain-containing protein [Phormidium sp. CCY1219]|uniref:DUF389 domain-containing protein n=1 Tax=Phormidium sp. CCY1219 TaxID=2886104 RepID=UPI002D1EF4ED|nr:DUF389 domain-containing protein [Phormidium sp. CCY1219]MEB3826573.1 DUF389 domain-containing protein [Phormidium sp. CCY1219]
MRQLQIRVPRGRRKAVMEAAQPYHPANAIQFEATDSGQPVDVVFLHIANQNVENLLQDLESIPEVHITLIPRGVMALQPPPSEAPDQVTDVTERSPLEIFLAGLQSVGSWRGFLGYAVIGAVVVWIGLFTNTIYLLTASMLIAPFAGPAMNVAIATARGDTTLLWRSVLRYFSAITVSMLVAALLTLIFRQQSATTLMMETAEISAVSVLLPLSAGTAGGLNLIQSDRSSLVSGASIGILVAASLAPPAGLVGMAGALGRWDMAVNGLFLVLLQLVGINFSAALVFRLFGVNVRGARYDRGRKMLFPLNLGVTAIALIGLLTWQFSSTPNFQRSSLTQRISADIGTLVDNTELVKLVDSEVRFTKTNIKGQNTLLTMIYVQRQPNVTLPDDQIRQRLTREIQSQIRDRGLNVTPLVSVTVLDPPPVSQ